MELRMHRVVSWILGGILFCALPGWEWSDPEDDTLPTASPPALDLVGVSATFTRDGLVVKLMFNNATTDPADLEGMVAYIDFDTDLNENTGRQSHIDEFGLDPGVVMGADYYIVLNPYDPTAKLFYIPGADEVPYPNDFPKTIEGTTVTVTVPRCHTSPDEGICIGPHFRAAVLIQNGNGDFTDRAPNGSVALLASPVPGDFNEDGTVDDADLGHLRTCVTGPAIPIPQNPPGCIDADLDHDGDVDQSDFAIFQENWTGSL